VYGEGKLGDIAGRIYTGWRIIPEVPFEAKLVRRGLDFGYSVDQSGIVGCYEYNGGLIFDEELYLKGQSNKQLADFLLNREEKCLVIGDSAEPKSIAEIKDYGVNIIGAIKRKEKTGKEQTYNQWAISQVQNYKKISVTEHSLNLIKEYRNYVWSQDKDGKFLPEPESTPDHLLDPIKYCVVSLISPVSTGVTVKTPQYSGYNKTYTAPTVSAPRTMPTIIRHRT
jgi:phage terminase large subunit